ncbi:P-loop containing nucleoside triphosphate hydrolase protein [Elsinoe ampelina]|uniref:RNA helicase n=1 Tax=Elsinoe ampelina TaxID=302913 RepID=A0A6A6GPA1_9PEZI|nr:P-loop containing nucleoside triphosphate hydrolase protein [Elsinoe ampelina]
MKDRKRRKLDGTTITQPPTKAKTDSKRVRLENLDWKDVDMPDKLDDYEGFFGLEEIDDVDVVKDDLTGVVSFASRAPVAKTGKSAPRVNGHAHPTEGRLDQQPSDSDVDDDEAFEGFSDDDAEQSSVPNSILKATKQLKKTAAKEKPKPKKKGKKPLSSTTDVRSAFEAMQDDDDEDVDVSAWRELNLSPDTLAGLSKLKFTKPTPIQRATIPEISSGSDVIGKASTGSGKTLAFGIPIFETYLDQRSQRANDRKKGSLAPLAVIVSPTRELAHQISQHLLELSQGFPGEKPVIATLVGGLSIQKQQRFMEKADVIVGTPGRLWEVISGGKDLISRMKQMQYLVLDEADRLLSQGHFKDLEELLNALDRTVHNDDGAMNGEQEPVDDSEKAVRQTLIFSATFQKDLQHKLERKQKGHYKIMDKKESMEYLLQRLNFHTKPKFIDVDPKRQMAANLKEGIVECGGQEKDLYLYALHLLHPTSRTLVFVNSISSVRRVVPFLQNLNLPALPLHSQMPQKARLRSIERFTSSSTTSASILVATDVAARGLDIPSIDLVLHYHLPRTADMYIHRSGRTARAGNSGSSILLCAPEEVGGVRRLVARVHANSAASANMSRAEAAEKGFMIRSLDIDRRVVQRLRPRTELAKRIADVENAKEKKHSGDELFKRAAEDLGVEYDSEELDREATGKRGRGSGRRQKEREDREVGRDEVRGLKGQLKGLLAQRVNVGVSERYPTGGSIDIDALLKETGGEGKGGEFLGSVGGLDMDV